MNQIKSGNYFKYDHLNVFFKHTDYHGFVHPYNFYEWTSFVREAFFQQTVSNFIEVVMRPIKMMTVKIESELCEDALFGDALEARLTIGKIKRVSFDIIIRFINLKTQRISCKTIHKIVFVDSNTAKFAEIPREMMEVIVHYEDRE